MNGVQWLFIIAGALVLAVVALYILHRVASRTGRSISEWIEKRGYVRDAKKHNKRAREIRLSRDEWEGLPLPKGKEGQLRITRYMMENTKNPITLKQYERALEMRAEDLWIALWRTDDFATGDHLIRWEPRKDKRPREVY